jgi:hypothetical protein
MRQAQERRQKLASATDCLRIGRFVGDVGFLLAVVIASRIHVIGMHVYFEAIVHF